jgi:hypothetical protein
MIVVNKIIYIDANPTLLHKNAYKVDKYIDAYEKHRKSIFVSLNSAYEDYKKSANSIIELESNKNKLYIIMPTYNPRYIEKYLKSEKPDCVVLCGYRVPDIVWLAVCNKLGIRTIYFQHGFDISHVKRKIVSVLREYRKVAKYFIAILKLSFYLGVNPLAFSLDYIKFIAFGADFKGSLFEDVRLWPNKFFVYSGYYIKFWKNKIGISEDRIEVIGAADLMNVDETKKRNYENSVCYLAQTFVEDGRISKTQFNKIIDQYRVLALAVDKLYIKLHPRSDLSFYRVLADMDNVELIREYFPYSSIYISHYSSTVFLARHLSNNVIIHNLPDDPSPEIFKEVASFISSEIEQIIEYTQKCINDPSSVKTKQNDILDYIAPIPSVHPLQTVASRIMKDA